ncbi:MAG TPA: glycosyl hydrolase family 65 protein [Candidatus Limnocylindria bacterium]|nr:glycosyl hydrolase family 65 protein [Candidatus Limnocylindria bacterium]
MTKSRPAIVAPGGGDGGSSWRLTYDSFVPSEEGRRESLCTVGNGYFATRGAAPEARADDVHYPGTYVAGCYNRLESTIVVGMVEDESMVNLPNWLVLDFRIEDGPWFDLRSTHILDYRLELDMRRAVLERQVRWRDEQGRITRVEQRRFVHLVEVHLAGLETTFTAENWSGTIEVSTALDGRVRNSGVERDRPLADDHLLPVEATAVDEDTIALQVDTSQSRVRIAQTARTRVLTAGRLLEVGRQTIIEDRYAGQLLRLEVSQGQPIQVEKVVVLYTSRDRAISEAGLESRTAIERAGSLAELLATHVRAWDHLWQRFYLALDGDREAQRVLNLHVFHLLQTVSPNTIELDVGVPARGLHGEAYKGHIFWDELFIFPYLTLHMPELTRSLLGYRYRRLREARWAARLEGHRGAMFPWQSGSNGREETDRFYLNPRSGRWIADHTHLQRHVGAAIAYNAWKYYQATGDVEFLDSFGAELIIDIARFWASLARFNDELGRYEICGVMGPDEFHDRSPDRTEPGLDNNSYTNLMAVWTICRALDCISLLTPDRWAEIAERLDIGGDEVELMADVSRRIRVVFHDGVISQFEGYEQLEEFDWDGYRRRYGNIQRLDLILEAEGRSPNQYRLSKQADVLMVFYLLSAEELGDLFERLGYDFHPQLIPATIDYYLARSSEGSTLSRVANAWVLSRSDRAHSWRWFKEALKSDIADIQDGTTPEGIHLGAMAGTVDIIQRCYTGLDVHGNVLWLNPRLPSELGSLDLHLQYLTELLHVEITADQLRVQLDPAARKSVRVGLIDRVVELEPGMFESVRIGPEPPTSPRSQKIRPAGRGAPP